MPVPYDFPLAIHAITADRDNFARDRQRRVWQRDAVKFQLQPTLAPEVAWLLGLSQMARKIGTSREQSAAELLDATRVADHRITRLGRGRGKTWLIQRTLEKTSSRNDCFFCLPSGQSRQTQND